MTQSRTQTILSDRSAPVAVFDQVAPTLARPVSWILLAACLVLVAFSGCTRQYHRLAADREAYRMLQSRQFDDRWKIPFRKVEPDPTSRLADINNPDCGPVPPDDPASEGYMRHPYRSKPVKYWDQRGRGGPVDSEHWLSYLPYNEDGEVVISKEFALDLALTHNRDFQGSVESLYLQSLSLSQSRFAFDVNWGGGSGASISASGAEGDPRTIPISSSLSASRNFAAGGQLVANFVNSLTYQVGGGESNFAASSLLFSLTQPLLRNAFRHVRMEGLTQAERGLLYSVRDFAHFRREFYQSIVNQYLDLLVQSQQIRIEEENLRNLDLNLTEHEILLKRDLVSQIQRDQVFQSYQSGRISLIQTKNSLQGAMDQFKFTLGLPAKVKIKIDESILAPFTINSDEMEKLQADADKLQNTMTKYIPPKEAPLAFLKDSYAEMKKIHARALALTPQVKNDLKKWNDRLDANKPTDATDEDQELEYKQQREFADRMAESFKLFDKRIVEVGKKIAAGEQVMINTLEKGIERPTPEGEADEDEPNLDGPKKESSDDSKKSDTESDADGKADADKSDEDDAEEDDKGDGEDSLLKLSSLNLPDLKDFSLEEVKKTPAVLAMNELEGLVTKDLQGVVSSLFLNQAQIRLFLIEVKPVDLDEQTAVELALKNRLDLMNQRAQVVDSYRGVEIAADALQSGLDLSASARLGTDNGRDNGFRFDGESSSYNVGLQLDGPLNRVSERNSYRNAQISYQQARRSYMAAEDSIVNGIRANLRSLTVVRFNFQTTRQSLIAATRQVDEARLALRQANSADSNLTQNLLQALNTLRGAKNSLISSWLSYETSRIGLFVDLELLLLDEGGNWINEDEELNLSRIQDLSAEANDGQPSIGSDESGTTNQRADDGFGNEVESGDSDLEENGAEVDSFFEPTDLGGRDYYAPPGPVARSASRGSIRIDPGSFSTNGIAVRDGAESSQVPVVEDSPMVRSTRRPGS